MIICPLQISGEAIYVIVISCENYDRTTPINMFLFTYANQVIIELWNEGRTVIL